MKSLITIIVSTLILTACGRASSPDGRSQIRDENIQREVDSLKVQHTALLDSIRLINKKLNSR